MKSKQLVSEYFASNQVSPGVSIDVLAQFARYCYNKGLEEAAENANVTYDSIDNFVNHNETYVVDKQSIRKLKI